MTKKMLPIAAASAVAVFAAVSPFAVAAGGMEGLGFPRDGADKTLRADFKTPPPGYGEVPFWWWSGREPLDKERMLEQIEELHKAGIAGVQVNYAHYRTGTRPSQDSTPKLFSDEWWDYFSFAAQECGKRGMGISLSNYTLDFPEGDNLWTKLGISTPEMRATELAYEKGKIVKRKVPRTYDPLNPESGKRVVERFFNPFMEKVPEHLRGGLNYFFQDELILSRDILWLWSDDLPAEFKKRKGYDIEPLLPALFGDAGPDTVKVRLDMNDVMSALACERYYKPIYDWHASRGLIYGCDQATRGKHPMNKYIDYMRVMKYFTAPGFDTPGRSADIIKNKVGSSIAHLYRRPRVWLEGYHSQGWQASTTTIFDSTCHNYLYGSNLLNLHGLYYSTYGGWWEWAPPCYHFRMPYWTYMKTFLKYFERLSYILSQGDHVCDVAVVNPLEPCVYNRNRGNVSVGVAHDIVRRLVTEAQTDVDFIDADSLARATVGRGVPDAPRRSHRDRPALCVAGEAYRVVVVPDMIAIRSSTIEKLLEFKRAGGVVVFLGAKPQFTDTPHKDKAKIDAMIAELVGDGHAGRVTLPAKPSAEQLKAIADSVGAPDFRAPGAAKALHRRIGAYDVYFICDLKEAGECTFRATGTPELWNPWDGTQKALTEFTRNADGTTTVKIAGDGAPKLVVFAEKTASVQQQAVSSATGLVPSSSITLDGDWDITLKPTLDNKWGDFRLPVRERYIGAEIRSVKMVGAEKLNLPAEMTVGFGPQFIDGKGSFFHFSWREGAEGMPGFQDWHHGLNGIVGDDFFVLGPYNKRHYDAYDPTKGKQKNNYIGEYHYDSNRPGKNKPGIYSYKTFVYAPSDCKAKPVAHGVVPVVLKVDGAERKIGEEIALAAGYHELSVTYDDFGRAALVMMRTDVKSVPSKVPLSMCWYNDPAVLPFDPFCGKVKDGVYTATLPPACEEVEITMRGTLLSANIAGAEAHVESVGRGVPDAPQMVGSRVSRDRIYRVKPRVANAGVAALTLKVAHEPGFIGGAAFTEPMRLKCGKGKIALGNWALAADGLRFYSGGAVYEKAFTLTKEKAGQDCTLDLGGVGVCCGVSVNGGEEKVLCCPPWRVDVGGKLKEGANTLKVTVYNTLNNHYQTIPTRYRTTVENAPSGLLGPVRLEFSWKRAADALRATLSRDAKAIACKAGGFPGCLVTDGESAVPIVFARADGKSYTVAAAGTYGKGRAVAVTHHGFFEGEEGLRDDNIAFLRDCVLWLAGDASKVTMYIDRRLGASLPAVERALGKCGREVELKALQGFGELASLSKGTVVLTMPDAHPRADAGKMADFIARGGGVLAPAVGWGWKQIHPDKSLRSDCPFNAVLGPAGIYSTGAFSGNPRGGLYEVAGMEDRPGTTMASAFALVEGGVAMSKETAAECLSTIDMASEVLPMEQNGWGARLESLQRTLDETVMKTVPSPAHPIRSGMIRERLAFIMMQSAWQANPERNWRAVPAAAVYPGLPEKGSPRVTRDIDIDLSVPRRHGTGLFAAAGEPITVTLPEGAEKLGLSVRVGATTCRNTSSGTWRRAPVVDVAIGLKKRSITFSSPFGGPVYIEVPGGKKGKVSVKVGPACPAPWFVEGRDTPETWAAQLKGPTAPFAEIESERIVLTVPTAAVKGLADPRPLLKVWREIMDNDAWLTGIPAERASPERMCTDVQLCCGYMHSGYPIMIPDGSARRLVSEPTIRAGKEDDVWGFFHEMGHNHQNYDWTFDGTVEVTVNFFTLLNMKRICGHGLWDMKIGGEGMKRRVKEWNDKGRPFGMWKSDPFLALHFFARLIDRYGWDTFQKLFAEYRALPQSERPKNDLEKRKQWCSRLSRIVGEDLTPEFEFMLK